MSAWTVLAILMWVALGFALGVAAAVLARRKDAQDAADGSEDGGTGTESAKGDSDPTSAAC